ncbi:MAG: hypothetical protein OHK0028_04990 [Deltaproteobacteria bacterium]
MNRPFRIAFAVAAAYAIAYGGLWISHRRSPGTDPHAVLREPARCPTCHLEDRPAAGRPYRQMNFRKDIFTLCTSCHPSPVTHPVDVAPRRGIVGNLPLDADGTMTCVTCHAPHSRPIASERYVGRTLGAKLRDTAFPLLPGRFRTYFLRVPNTRGELCERCHSPGAIASRRSPGRGTDPAEYAGSRACAGCHPREYEEWSRSPHARMVRSPGTNRGAVLAKFEGSSPFPPSEIAYVLGSRSAQRFVSRKGNDLVVRTPIWIVRSGKWNLDYWREQDWRKSCAGCHVTGYDPDAAAFVEEGIGCESCHGPGHAHAASGRRDGILHPGKIPGPRREMICEACHTTGHDATGEYRFPVGYRPGADLSRYFFGMVPKPGQDDSTFRGDGTAADRHAQFRFWSSRMLVAEGETCDLCKNFRDGPGGSPSSAEPKKMTASEFCISCHGGGALPAPLRHGESNVVRSRKCLSCHPVRRARSGVPSVHDHKFLPEGALGGKAFPPDPDFRSICYVCHPVPGKGA